MKPIGAVPEPPLLRACKVSMEIEKLGLYRITALIWTRREIINSPWTV